MTNEERVREFLRLSGAMQIDALGALLADCAVLELPFAPGQMSKIHQGKPAILEFLRFACGRFSAFAMKIDAVYPTSDPNVVIAEHHSIGVVAKSGRPYRNRYATFFTFDSEGRVVTWREYFDAGVVVRAFGRLTPAARRSAGVP